MDFVLCSIVRIFILISFLFHLFDSIDGYHGEVEVPELVKKTAQGGLVGEFADQESLTILLRYDGGITEPIRNGWTQGSFKPDTICASMLNSFSTHDPCPFSFKNEWIL
jgi:hypothetical protein